MFECGSSGDSNAAARVVTLSPKFCHITPVLVNLHWLRIDLRIEFKMFTVTYKTLHGLAPTHIKDLLQSYLAAEDLRASKEKKSACRTCFQLKQLWSSCVFCCYVASLEHSSSAYQGCWITAHF